MTPDSLIKLDRLRKRTSFLLIQREGGYAHAPFFTIQAMRSEKVAPDTLRVGYVVTKRVGGAVERNRAKRRLRALFRAIAPPNARGGHDYVLIAKKPLLEAPWASLGPDLEKAMAEVHRRLDRPKKPILKEIEIQEA